ncbi:hypothetical protein Taro_033145 [Colocasia esculenta]|uniref:Uncharacterized protein n=1 Tax=Colocasia esculenta TaxID=4460 RepID=A0A843VWZ2_COLES|nr:hypothetical protein [Colocasia esculenta]
MDTKYEVGTSWPSSPTPSGSCRGEAPTVFAAPPRSHHCRRRCFFLPCSAPAALSAVSLSLSAFYSSQNPVGGVSSGRGRSRRRPRGRLTVLYVSPPPTFAAAQGRPRGGGRGRPSAVRQLGNPHLCLLEACFDFARITAVPAENLIQSISCILGEKTGIAFFSSKNSSRGLVAVRAVAAATAAAEEDSDLAAAAKSVLPNSLDRNIAIHFWCAPSSSASTCSRVLQLQTGRINLSLGL